VLEISKTEWSCLEVSFGRALDLPAALIAVNTPLSILTQIERMNELSRLMEQHNADVAPLTHQHTQARKERAQWIKGKSRAENQHKNITAQIKMLMEVRVGMYSCSASVQRKCFQAGIWKQASNFNEGKCIVEVAYCVILAKVPNVSNVGQHIFGSFLSCTS
jgi:hypothetical protein